MYCGSEVKIEEISSKVKTDEVEKIHTYLELGNEAIIANNYKQAYEYSLKALEISPKSSESWFFKMKSLDG
ncbi:MAG TPA: hypothetical protein PK891_04185, partial [Bacteroidales bacterium]|nr:hypothetical protein [Bacteroidales bacterium]